MPTPVLADRLSLLGGGFQTSVGGFAAVYPPFTGGDEETAPTILDVGRWKLVEGFEETPVTCSGLMGATDSRRTGYVYAWEMDIVFDLRSPPDILLRPIRSFQIVFWFGDLDKCNLVDGDGFPIDGQPLGDDRYYWSPMNKLDQAAPILDANGKRMMGIHVSGHATGHVFLVPDMGDPNKPETLAGAYRAYLKTQGILVGGVAGKPFY